MATTGQKVALMRRNAEIFELSVQGKTNEEIAKDYSITPQRVGQILKQIELETAIHLRDHLGPLLLRQYARSETIIERLMDEAFTVLGKDEPNYAAIDRIEKYQKGQREILAGAQHLIAPDDDADSNKYDPDLLAQTDSEYLDALEMIKEDDDFELLVDGN